jgi:two-component system chemotaxis sensor kinase CheA
VLLVDDSAFFRDMLTPVLKASGYRVHTAANVDDALRILAGGLVPDVLVTDLEMPGEDGFALIDAVRAMPALADLPVIALASGHDPNDIGKARRHGVHDIIAKFDRSGLMSSLSELLSTHKQAA